LTASFSLADGDGTRQRKSTPLHIFPQNTKSFVICCEVGHIIKNSVYAPTKKEALGGGIYGIVAHLFGQRA